MVRDGDSSVMTLYVVKMKKILILMFGMLFFLSFVSAIGDSTTQTESRFTGKQNFPLIIYDTCTTSGFDCDGTYNCTFSIISPSRNIIVNNVTAIRVGNLYTYNLSTGQTTEIGNHEVISSCNNQTDAGRLTFYYDITPSGFKDTLGFYIFIFLLSFGIIILGFSIRDGWVTLFGTFGLYFVSLYILFYGLVGMKDNVYTWGIGLVTLGIAMYISTKTVMEMIEN